MSATSRDPLAAVVHAHIAELHREADDRRLARAVVRDRRQAPAWPTAVAKALRDSVADAMARHRAATADKGRNRACCAS